MVTVGGMGMATSYVYSLGGSGTSLMLSGGVATVTLSVPNVSYNGKTLSVYRSDNNGISYASVNTCVVSNTLTCSFTTDHFSYFALGVPAPVVVVSGGGSSVGPGGPVAGGLFGNIFFGGFSQGNVTTSTGTNLIVKLKKTINQNLKKFLFFPSGKFTINGTKNIVLMRSSKAQSGNRIVGFIKKGQSVIVNYIDANGWALVVNTSGVW